MSAIGPSAPRIPEAVNPATRAERVRRPGREDGAEDQGRERQQPGEEGAEERSEDEDGRVHIDLRA